MEQGQSVPQGDSGPKMPPRVRLGVYALAVATVAVGLVLTVLHDDRHHPRPLDIPIVACLIAALAASVASDRLPRLSPGASNRLSRAAGVLAAVTGVLLVVRHWA